MIVEFGASCVGVRADTALLRVSAKPEPPEGGRIGARSVLWGMVATSPRAGELAYTVPSDFKSGRGLVSRNRGVCLLA